MALEAAARLPKSIVCLLLCLWSASKPFKVQAGNERLCHKFSQEADNKDKQWFCWYQDPCAGPDYTYPSAFRYSTPCKDNEDKASCEFLPDDVDFCERWVEIPDSATRERCPGFDCCASDYGEFYEENFCEDLQCDDRGPNNVMCVEDNCNQEEVMTEDGCKPAPPQVPWPPPLPSSPPPSPPAPPTPPPRPPPHPPPSLPPSPPPFSPEVPISPPSPFMFRPAQPQGPPAPVQKSPPPNRPFTPFPPFAPLSPSPAPPVPAPTVQPSPSPAPSPSPILGSPPAPSGSNLGTSPSPSAPDAPDAQTDMSEPYPDKELQPMPPPPPPDGEALLEEADNDGSDDGPPWWIWLVIAVVAALLVAALGAFLWHARRQRLERQQQRRTLWQQHLLLPPATLGEESGSHVAVSFQGSVDSDQHPLTHSKQPPNHPSQANHTYCTSAALTSVALPGKAVGKAGHGRLSEHVCPEMQQHQQQPGRGHHAAHQVLQGGKGSGGGASTSTITTTTTTTTNNPLFQNMMDDDGPGWSSGPPAALLHRGGQRSPMCSTYVGRGGQRSPMCSTYVGRGGQRSPMCSTYVGSTYVGRGYVGRGGQRSPMCSRAETTSPRDSRYTHPWHSPSGGSMRSPSRRQHHGQRPPPHTMLWEEHQQPSRHQGEHNVVANQCSRGAPNPWSQSRHSRQVQDQAANPAGCPSRRAAGLNQEQWATAPHSSSSSAFAHSGADAGGMARWQQQRWSEWLEQQQRLSEHQRQMMER